MIKLSRSEMHEQNIVTFFSGTRLAAPGSPYMFEESSWLFAQENLGVNLIEYSRPENVRYLMEDPKIQKFVEGAKGKPGTLPTLIDVTIARDLQVPELALKFSPQYMEGVRVKMLASALTTKMDFTAKADEMGVRDRFPLTGFETNKFTYLKVTLSEGFLERKKQLSDKNKSLLDAARYVDPQAAFFMIMTCMSGTAKAAC